MVNQTKGPTDQAINLLGRARAERPLTQCVTNFVSMDLVANALHALGASPAMAEAPEEAEDFARNARALVCNLGTPSRARVDALEAAASAFHARAKPWVFDPVGVGASAFRQQAAARLLRQRPTAIRGNASEILWLARIAGASDAAPATRGLEGRDGAEAALPAAMALARALSCVVAATGDVDALTDGARVVRVANGSPLMARVTGMGCALSAVTAALLGLGDSALASCVAASLVFGVAGELAERSGPAPMGPASFRVHFIDRLYDLTPEALRGGARVTEEPAPPA